MSEDDFVLSTGGGTPCYYNNHLLFEKENMQTIYLKASINTITQRLVGQKDKRPLIQSLSNNDLAEYVGKHLFERSYYYNKAKYTISVDAKAISQIVDEIVCLLQ